MLSVFYNSTSNTVHSQPHLRVDAIGGESADLAEHLAQYNYTENEDLFFMGYDWRIASVGLVESFYPELKAKIELVSEEAKESVGLLGYSLGAEVLHFFLTKFVSEEWKGRFVSDVVLLAPALVGGVDAFLALWSGVLFDFLPRNDISLRFGWSLLIGHTSLANPNYFDGLFRIVGPDGTEYSAVNQTELLFDHSSIAEEFVGIHNIGREFFMNRKESPKVRTHILYNSGVETRVGVNISSWEGSFESFYDFGDGSIASKPIEKLCFEWGVQNCIDLNTELPHGVLESIPDVARYINSFLNPQ
jgi:hypothetical protein